MQRLSQVEADVAKLSDLKSQMATVEERTKNTADDMKAMREDLGRITTHLLDESRTFIRQASSRSRRPPA